MAAALRALQQDTPLHYAPGHGAPAFHAPRTLAEFAALREALPQARVLAGGTDMGLWVTKQFRDLGELIYVGEVAELKRIEVQLKEADWKEIKRLQGEFPVQPPAQMEGEICHFIE